MNPLTTAVMNKLGKATDRLTGTRRVNNLQDPTSAASMRQRKIANTKPTQLKKNITIPSVIGVPN